MCLIKAMNRRSPELFSDLELVVIYPVWSRTDGNQARPDHRREQHGGQTILHLLETSVLS